MAPRAERVRPELSDRILVALRRIIRATDLHSRRLLRDFGLTGPQLIVLREVAAAEEIFCSALAEAVSVSLPTVTGILARLEARGLVGRRRNTIDRRQMLVSITPAGRELLAAAPPPLQERFSRQLAALEEWERTQVLAVLQRVVAMMEAETLDASPVLTTGELSAPRGETPADPESPPLEAPAGANRSRRGTLQRKAK